MPTSKIIKIIKEIIKEIINKLKEAYNTLKEIIKGITDAVQYFKDDDMDKFYNQFHVLFSIPEFGGFIGFWIGGFCGIIIFVIYNYIWLVLYFKILKWINSKK